MSNVKNRVLKQVHVCHFLIKSNMASAVHEPKLTDMGKPVG